MQRAKKHFGFGGRFFRWRNALGTAFALLLILCPWGRLEVKPWQAAVGLTLVAAGVGLRLWAIRQIGGSARKKSSLKAIRLITWGPFAMVRNPIYVANMTVFAGFVVLSGLLWALPLVVGGLWLWYDALIRREESFLRATFPVEYGAYEQRTHRWLPVLRPCRRPVEIPAYPLVRALHRERSHLLLVVCSVLAFWALSVFHHGSALAVHDPGRVAAPPSRAEGRPAKDSQSRSSAAPDQADSSELSAGARASSDGTESASTSPDSSSVPRRGEGARD